MNATPEARQLTDLLSAYNKAELARRLRVNPSTVARWARGETVPSGDTLIALAKVLGIPADSILVGTGA